MSIVNFSIPQALNEKIQKTINDQGFSSKAEFFRFAAIYFMQNFQQKNQEEKYNETMQELSMKLQEKFKNKEIPSLEEQFADL